MTEKNHKISEFLYKRKREGSESEKVEVTADPFKRSKKVSRSPERERNVSGETGERMEEIIESIKRIKEEIIMEWRKDFRKMEEDLATFKERVIKIEADWVVGTNKIENRLVKVEKKCEEMAKREKRNNIVIRGAEFEEEVGCGEVKKFFKEKLMTEVDLESVYSIKKNNKITTFVKVKSWKEKQRIMENKNKLRGTKIVVEHEMTERELEVQNLIWKKSIEERDKGYKTRMGYRKLWVGEKLFVWDEENNVLKAKN